MKFKYSKLMTVTALEIREIRKRNNITQEELAKKLGVSRNTVVSYERGAVIPESKLVLLRTVLGLDDSKVQNQKKGMLR